MIFNEINSQLTLIKKKIETDPNCHSVRHYLLKRPYYNVCKQFPDEYFDLILVDGRNRKGCIIQSLSKLKKGGILMLDNAERSYYHAVYEYMEGWECFNALQTKPDSCNFYYPNWLTTWWIKPINR